ncbi:MAG: phage portal protein [Bacteroidota bacterium]
MSFRTSIESWYRSIISPVYEKLIDGSDWYFIDGTDPFTGSKENLDFALAHPILTPAILFQANLFAQARFEVRNKKTKEVVEDHPLITLLNDPNFFDTKIDFLERLQFLKISQGRVGIYLRRGSGSRNVDSLYVLREDLIEFPEDFEVKYSFRSKRAKFESQTVIYDKEGMNLPIKLKDIIWLYDLPSGHDTKNLLKNKSRIDGLSQTLKNTYDSLVAKNIILKSNGKEMLSSGTGNFPFNPDEQEKAKQKWNEGYGVGFGRSRVYMTAANVTWKSLHIALRDLGLDESTKVDGNIIYTALHIPKDILSLEAKKTTYNNFKESMTSYIQNDIQAMLNDLTESFNILIEDGFELVGNYDHLPVMQFLEKQKYDAVNSRAVALTNLRKSGIPDELALDLVGLPKNTKLEPLQQTNEKQGETQQTEENNQQEETE